jgi:hypothetical protein
MQVDVPQEARCNEPYVVKLRDFQFGAVGKSGLEVRCRAG